jgi:hypothetical protein
MVSEQIAVATVLIGAMTSLVIVLRTGLEHLSRAKMMRLQADLYHKMLEKFGSNQELLNWLSSEGGQGLLRTVEHPKPGVYGRILTSAQVGILATVLGIGLLLVAANLLSGSDQNALAILASIVLTAGIGLLVGGLATYALSRRFGLLNGTKS